VRVGSSSDTRARVAATHSSLAPACQLVPHSASCSPRPERAALSTAQATCLPFSATPRSSGTPMPCATISAPSPRQGIPLRSMACGAMRRVMQCDRTSSTRGSRSTGCSALRRSDPCSRSPCAPHLRPHRSPTRHRRRCRWSARRPRRSGTRRPSRASISPLNRGGRLCHRTRGFLDNVTIAPSVGAPSGTSPWVAVAAGAALLTGMIALARYYDEKKTR